MKFLAGALLLSVPFVLGQTTGDDSTLGPSPGCYKGSTIGAKMIQMPPGYLKEAAAEQCFQYCSTLIPETRVLANMFDKSNRRKSRVHCKCFDAEDVANPVSLVCTDVATDNPSPVGRKASLKDQMKDGVNKKNKRGKAKKCKKCTAVGPKVPSPVPMPVPTPDP